MKKAVRRPVGIKRASEVERARARDIVKLCQQALAAGGTLVLNPEDPYEEQLVFSPDVEYLLGVLEGFARHGTFHHDPEGVLFPFLQALQVREALEPMASSRTKDKVEAVMSLLAVNERTAYDLIKRYGR